MPEIYEQMLINYVWYIVFERVEGGAKLLRYYRRHYKSLYKPTAVGAGYPVESDDGKRTIVAVEFIPYGKTEKERLEVVNPGHVFCTTWTETSDGRLHGLHDGRRHVLEAVPSTASLAQHGTGDDVR